MTCEREAFPVHVPGAPLRPFVAVSHGYRVPANPVGVHRGLPSRHLTLVIELRVPLRITGTRGDAVAAHGVVGGLHTRAVLIDASEPQEGLQYGLTPLGAHALLGVPAAELCGHAVDLADLLGARARRLVNEIQAATCWNERFGLVDTALLQRLQFRGTAPPAEVSEVWRLIFTSNGRVSVAALAAHVGWSRRHLGERFRLATGFSPKQAARVARFEAARRLLLQAERPALRDIAARCGFADQPHLAREWQAMAGCTISTWLREELPFVQDSYVLDSAELPA